MFAVLVFFPHVLCIGCRRLVLVLRVAYAKLLVVCAGRIQSREWLHRVSKKTGPIRHVCVTSRVGCCGVCCCVSAETDQLVLDQYQTVSIGSQQVTINSRPVLMVVLRHGVGFDSGHFYHTNYKVLGEFPHQPLYLPHTSPLVTANAPPMFCPFQLRTSNMSESSCDLRGLCHCLTLRLGVALMSTLPVGCFVSWPGDECVVASPSMSLLIDIKIFFIYTYCIVTGGESGPRSALVTPRPRLLT